MKICTRDRKDSEAGYEKANELTPSSEFQTLRLESQRINCTLLSPSDISPGTKAKTAKTTQPIVQGGDKKIRHTKLEESKITNSTAKIYTPG